MNRTVVAAILCALSVAACEGPQTQHIFRIRAPSDVVYVPIVDHSREHDKALQEAIDKAVRAQEVQDLRQEVRSELLDIPNGPSTRSLTQQ
jgi:hypothetical protein